MPDTSIPGRDEPAAGARESLLVRRALDLLGMPAQVEPVLAAEGPFTPRMEGRLSALLLLPDGQGLLVCPEDRARLDRSRIETWSRALEIIESLTSLGSPPRLRAGDAGAALPAAWRGERSLCGEAILVVHRCLRAVRGGQQVGLTALHLGDWLRHLSAGQRLARAEEMLTAFLPRCRTVCLDAERLLVVEAPATATRERECTRYLLLADTGAGERDAVPILACGTLAGPAGRETSATGLVEGVLGDLELMRTRPAAGGRAPGHQHGAWVLILEPRCSVAEAIRWCVADAGEALAAADLAGADLLLEKRATAPLAAFLVASLEATPASEIGRWVDARLPPGTPVIWIRGRLGEGLPALETPRSARQLVKPFDAAALARIGADLFPRAAGSAG